MYPFRSVAIEIDKKKTGLALEATEHIEFIEKIEVLREFMKAVSLRLFPRLFLYFTEASVKLIGFDLVEEMIRDPDRAYAELKSLMGGDSGVEFLDKQIALYIEMQNGFRLTENKILGLLKERRLGELLNIAEHFTMSSN